MLLLYWSSKPLTSKSIGVNQPAYQEVPGHKRSSVIDRKPSVTERLLDGTGQNYEWGNTSLGRIGWNSIQQIVNVACCATVDDDSPAAALPQNMIPVHLPFYAGNMKML